MSPVWPLREALEGFSTTLRVFKVGLFLFFFVSPPPTNIRDVNMAEIF